MLVSAVVASNSGSIRSMAGRSRVTDRPVSGRWRVTPYPATNQCAVLRDRAASSGSSSSFGASPPYRARARIVVSPSPSDAVECSIRRSGGRSRKVECHLWASSPSTNSKSASICNRFEVRRSRRWPTVRPAKVFTCRLPAAAMAIAWSSELFPVPFCPMMTVHLRIDPSSLEKSSVTSRRSFRRWTRRRRRYIRGPSWRSKGARPPPPLSTIREQRRRNRGRRNHAGGAGARGGETGEVRR